MSLSVLKALALLESRRKYPSLPDYARTTPKYSDRTTNGLTRMLIDFLGFSGHHAERVSNTGRPLDKRKIVTDVIGRTRIIGTMKWIHGTGYNGTADIHSVIAGKFVAIEVKIGRDRQSPAQAEYQAQVEQAGGVYVIATSFGQFMEWYETMEKILKP
jgi:hypothetical protein